MRTALHDPLRAFAEEAGLQLEWEIANGAEVPFEVDESPGERSALYSYRPLTGEFIRERMGELGRLPTHTPAIGAIESVDGIDDYLRARGEPRVPSDAAERADAALRSFLGAVYDGLSEFAFPAERFERAYAELEGMVFHGRAQATVAAPLLGIELDSSEVKLGEGLALVRGDALDGAPAEAVWSREGTSARANTLVTLSVETVPGDGAPVTDARVRFRRLLTALRLWDAGSFALGPAAWSRTDSGPWQIVALGGSGRAHGAPLRLAAEDEEELRGFQNLIAGRMQRGGEVAWALARFEMGCERLAPFEALTDYLLGLRALLEPEGPSSGRLAGRLAAICAVAPDRPALAERVAHAISLERAVIAGLAPAQTGVDALVAELSDHLRALLRDVLCGHLDSDLRSVADELAGEAAPVAEVA